jgi:hypothetical protein
LGYVFNPAAPSVTYNLDLGTYTTCAVTTTDPTSANPVCTGDNSPNNGSISILSNVFVEYTLTGPGISGGQDFQTSGTDGTTETIDGLAPGDYTVTATGLSGHTINDQTVFQFSIITLTSPDCTVVAPTVSWTLASCAPDQEQIASAGFNAADTEILGGITLPADSDVTYEIDGVVTPAGGPYSEADGTHVITATLTSAAITAGKKIVANPGVYTLSDGDTVATWTVDFTASCLPTLAVLPWSVASTNAICTPSGQDGTVTVTDDTSQASTVTYIVTNLATNATLYSVTTTSTFSLAPGHYNVRAIPTDTADFGLTPNNGGFAYVDTAVTIAAAATSCGDLTSLAFTGGTIGWLGFVVAGGMLFLGIAFLYMKRRGNRTAE